MTSVQIFDIGKYFFLSQIGDNPKGYPLEIFENDHSVFKKSFQISKCDAKTILKKSLKLT